MGKPVSNPADKSGQTLAGRSFRGQDLRGTCFRKADLRRACFRRADLRGVDFREAKLAGADFRRARMGKGRLRIGGEFIFGLALGFVLFVIEFVGLVTLGVGAIQPLAKLLLMVPLSETEAVGWGIVPLLSLQGMLAGLARWGRLEWVVPILLTVAVVMAVAMAGAVAVAVAVAVTGAAAVAVAATMAVAGAVAVAVAGAVVGAGAVAVAVAGTGAGAVAGAMAGVLAGALAGVKAGAGAMAMAGLGAGAVVGAGIVTGAVAATLWVGVGLNRQAVRREAPELDWLRRWSLRWGAAGTDFRGADLAGAVFSGARLAHARLAGASLARTRWRGARDLCLANAHGTVLQPKAVRDTLTGGDGRGRNFAGLDLRGLDFSRMTLAEADFTGADLSGARLAGADLTAAKLTRAVLLGATLSRARLTGARIGQWNIDARTRFAGLTCDHVYLDEAGKDRQPESGGFRPGEFEKLYRETAHTVDFLIENPAQMDALLRSLAQVRADFGGEAAEVRKVERKDEVFKVGVAVPAEREDTLRKEIRREFDRRLTALEAEQPDAPLSRKHGGEHPQREWNSLEILLTSALSRPAEARIGPEAQAVSDSLNR